LLSNDFLSLSLSELVVWLLNTKFVPCSVATICCDALQTLDSIFFMETLDSWMRAFWQVRDVLPFGYHRIRGGMALTISHKPHAIVRR